MTEAEAREAVHQVSVAGDADRPVHMCGGCDCDCPTTEEFQEVLRRLEREHQEHARLIVAQLTNAAPKEAKHD
jgi:L-lactate utilization protein LutB